MSLTYCSPQFVDGVEKLHLQLHDVYLKAEKIHDDLVGAGKKSSRIFILVDFNEEQTTEKLKGYFVFDYMIHRFLPVSFDTALLFPIHNKGGGDIATRSGITYSEIKKCANEGKVMLYHLTKICFDDTPLYSTGELDILSSIHADKLDDIGMPIYSFPDIDYLSLCEVPTKFTENKYKLVGKNYYAPYTTQEKISCVLFAQLDNEYDTNAIKVLRWFPATKGVEIDQKLGFEPNGGDAFFELGYISRTENEDLHSFMVENHSRLLLGECVNDTVTIIGSIKMFQTNNLKYPMSLYKIKIK